jgi:hypothetical protein
LCSITPLEIFITNIIAIRSSLATLDTMEKIAKRSLELDQNDTSLLAYQLWEKASSPPGRDLEFWLQAEAKMRDGQKMGDGALPAVLVESKLSIGKPSRVTAPTAGTLEPNRGRRGF